jgi:hypothetical protein
MNKAQDQITQNFVVIRSDYDASRPFIVVATFRTWNKVVGRYATIEQANRRARDLNRNS